MKVFLANRGNPDYYQDPEKPLPGTRSDYWKEVQSFTTASKICQDYIERYNLGGGNFTGGEIKNGLGETIARVTYNGRVWKETGQEIKIT